MPREDRHIFEIAKLDDRTVTLIENEYVLSPIEWDRRRRDALAELRDKKGGLPELIDLLEDEKEETLVEIFFCFNSPVLNVSINVVEPQPQIGNSRSHMKASEALALFLRLNLRNLKYAETRHNGSPVRTLQNIPRSLIAEVAMDLLECCEMKGYPPGPRLNKLVRELLNLERDRHSMPREIEKQERAANMLAASPEMTTRRLARTIGVNASTVSRWRKSPVFKKMVEEKAKELRLS